MPTLRPAAAVARRRPWAALSLALLAAVLVVLAAMAPPTAAYTQAYKHKKLTSLVRSSNVMTLDSASFNALTEAPRNYSLAVLLTAMDPQVGCSVCLQFDPEFRTAAYSWGAHKGGKHPLYFASVDFMSARDVFSKLRLNSAPNVFFYPATEGPFALPAPKDGGGEYVNYDLPRKGISGRVLVDWIGEQTGEQFSLTTPPDYTKYAQIAVVAIGIILARKYILIGAKVVFLSRKLYALLSIATILLFTGGTMWNSIRNPPYLVSDRAGNPEYISAGLQTQHGIETQISAVLHGAAALSVVALTVAVPKIPSANMQRIAVALLVSLMVASYSVVCKIFSIKSPGYPYRILF